MAVIEDLEDLMGILRAIRLLITAVPWSAVGDGAGPARGDMDFIAVHGGIFEYAPSPETLVCDSEYFAQAEIIIDRTGSRYPLLPDEHQNLKLGPPSGAADIGWLREAWETAQQKEPWRYPLERVMPDSDEEFLASLFEMLEETAIGAAEGWIWKVRQPGRTLHLQTLNDVNKLLLKARDLPDTIVQDPYQHLYRPHRMLTGALALTHRHYLVYREKFPEDIPDT
ncbi:hypothetical protein [Arthrobacter sp. ok909]|uniref:hypothetical protein n=1 Tax=Arthrobacter sp. ok909 TaxID=1761746 RepID=UPI000B89178B|nr:hypothetical protein [Arthrobacter sp. ok909]